MLLAQSNLGHVILLWIVHVKVKVVIPPSQCPLSPSNLTFLVNLVSVCIPFGQLLGHVMIQSVISYFFYDHLAWYPSVEDPHCLFHACLMYCDLAGALLAFYHMLLALQWSSCPAWYVSTNPYFIYGLVWVGLAVPFLNFLVGDRVSELVPPIISSAESPYAFLSNFPWTLAWIAWLRNFHILLLGFPFTGNCLV